MGIGDSSVCVRMCVSLWEEVVQYLNEWSLD